MREGRRNERPWQHAIACERACDSRNSKLTRTIQVRRLESCDRNRDIAALILRIQRISGR